MIIFELGDYFLFNSDGLINMILGSEIFDIVISDIFLVDKAVILICFVNNVGGLDNIIVVFIVVNEEEIE